MRINEPGRFVQGLPGFDCIRAVVERLRYIHTVVQPAMNLLKVIDIEDAVSVLRLTNNRK